MSTSAPYTHEDGSNCWTKDCSIGNSTGSSSCSAPMQKDLVRIKKAIAVLDKRKAAIEEVETSVAKSGKNINSDFSLVTTLKGGFNPNTYEKPTNHKNDDLTWTKPRGGLWLATVNDEGENSWSANSEQETPIGFSTTPLRFKDDAKIIKINSKKEYLKVLAAFPHTPAKVNLTDSQVQVYAGRGVSSVNADGSGKRGIDFEALSKSYDAVLVTWAGLYESGRANSTPKAMGKDVSLYSWDIESVFVLNKDAIIFE